MEENNKNHNLENFSRCISKKYGIDENALIFCLYYDPKNYWNTLFKLINKKAELNPIEPIDEEKNDTNEVQRPTFDKDEIVKEIENYFRENPDEVDELWNKYKDNNIETEKNNNTQNDMTTNTSISNGKKVNSNNINNSEIRKVVTNKQKDKKSFHIKKDNFQKFNFSIGTYGNEKNQNNFGLIRSVKTISLSKNIKNSPSKKKKINFIIILIIRKKKEIVYIFKLIIILHLNMIQKNLSILKI